ncbi:hypothetical protein IVB25_29820 [Bradyrhizobium sp. 193]|uniref:hypothetical protein n=1 Tax=unclassified Bradyrhizobium TaxID=2631580 RepID=UPI0003718ED1|nr:MULTISPECIES: hypothetical protein [unclassified Bradyrhizobium]MCK1348061.1 hypothetical protein [Bradyrhizobium sp. CW11]MCK1486772.1 hypothetical protein [Bradyrhizobium sp. 193]MCK1580951.1 hypothetical protein [Bradyrhizobium sp. 168]MCK1591585.1 hypothetical protein [Bradyrhizobium sp. 169]UPK12674.1 hypothetical protein IVA93_05535 [Bradyrhizobium sp. 155]
MSGEFHGLKIQIIDDNTAVAFASSNAADAALTLIGQLAQELVQNAKFDPATQLAERHAELLASKKSDPPDCEFLVLRIDGDRKRLAHITDGVLKYVERAYIGDPAQYRRLLELKKPYVGPKQQTTVHLDGTTTIEPIVNSAGLVEFVEIGLALQALVEQRRGEGIGAIAGNIIRVVDARNSRKLEYLRTHEASITQAEGKAGYSLLASNSGKRGVGIYYVAGKVGFVMIAGDTEPCRKLPAETMDEFKQFAKSQFDLNLC